MAGGDGPAGLRNFCCRGGRCGAAGGLAGEGLALDVTRLAALPRRCSGDCLRYAAEQLGAAPDFAATEALRSWR